MELMDPGDRKLQYHFQKGVAVGRYKWLGRAWGRKVETNVISLGAGSTIVRIVKNC
jgi:hypothetical protein